MRQAKQSFARIVASYPILNLGQAKTAVAYEHYLDVAVP